MGCCCEQRQSVGYRGELSKDGKRNGYGILNLANGIVYEGFFKNDKRHGYGIQTWTNGTRYVGNFENDYRNGYGRLIRPGKPTLIGFWKDDDFVTHHQRFLTMSPLAEITETETETNEAITVQNTSKSTQKSPKRPPPRTKK